MTKGRSHGQRRNHLHGVLVQARAQHSAWRHHSRPCAPWRTRSTAIAKFVINGKRPLQHSGPAAARWHYYCYSCPPRVQFYCHLPSLPT